MVTMRKGRQKESGIALLIAIFILMLISVVAMALIVSSGTESALAGNYRSSTNVYYAAVGGLEEVRARLRANNPNSFKNTAPPGFLPTPLVVCNPSYVINPVGGEAITPWDPANAYYDNQFVQEFGAICPGGVPNPSPTTPSVWNSPPLNGLPFPGPLYKWVRISAITEQSMSLDTGPLYDGIQNNLVYYGGAPPSLNDTATGSQVLEITALAVLPNGTQQPTQKLLQYLVAPNPVTLPPFLAALTLSGSNSSGGNPAFQAPANNAVYAVKGDDYLCNGNPSGLPPKVAIGLFGDYSGGSYNTDINNIIGGIATTAGGPPPVDTRPNYTGLGAAPPTPNPPDVEFLTAYPASMQTPSELNALVQTISQSADVTLPSGPVTYPLPTVTGSSLPAGMSATNPMTVVVNGNLDVSGWGGTGYGLLLVIGTFTYDPSATWNGIVLVIGQGQINNTQHGLYEQMNGAVFVAKTRDPSGNPVPDPKIGGASVSFDPPMQGNGIRYSSCWIQKSVPISAFKILSFHEIGQ